MDIEEQAHQEYRNIISQEAYDIRQEMQYDNPRD
jgi:hypothetical protein